jgi:two-component system, sensor histidine kinase and response regulator
MNGVAELKARTKRPEVGALAQTNEDYVVCVDDDQSFLRSLSGMLPKKIAFTDQECRYRVLLFDKPGQALEALRHLAADGKSVALIISDQKMPDMKGTEFLREARRIFQDSARILLTGYAGVESAVEAINQQLLDRYLSKPIEDKNDFTQSVRQLLETHQMRKELKKTTLSKQYVDRIISSMTDSLVVLDEQDRIGLVNPALCELLGYEPAALRGQPFATLFQSQDRERVESWLGEVRTAGYVAGVAIDYQGKETGEHPVSLSGSVLQGDDGRFEGIVCVGHDMAKQRETERRLREAKEAAESANRSKSEFLARMSHEIRTPMNGVLGMAELLAGTDLTGRQARYVDAMHRSAESLLTIINDILDFSKIEAGKLELDNTIFDLGQLVGDVGDLLAEKAHGRGLELICDLPPDLPLIYRGDPGRLRQILVNLIGNAIKFTARGEVVVRLTLVETVQDTVVLRFEVRDTGIGIPEQVQTRIFDAFCQADGSTTRKYGGTGLGLAISKQLAELMGGELGVRSAPGKGSTFWFTVRLQRERGSLEAQHNGAVKDSRILIVDDNATNREILENVLSAWGICHASASSAVEALALLRSAAIQEQPYDLVILDYEMPDMNGLMLASVIRQEQTLAASRCLLLTSVNLEHDSPEWRQAGIELHLTKPVRQSVLFNSIAGLFAQNEDSADRQGFTADPAPAGDALTGRILLVEDNLVNQEVGLAMLEILGCKATCAADGKAALEALERDSYDVVLMDCHMPEMDGFEATASFRQWERTHGARRRTPIIALTANALPGDRERCLEAGMDDYMSKPFTQQQLAEKLRHWLFQASPGDRQPSREAPVAVSEASGEETVELDPQPLNAIRALQRPGAPDVLGRVIARYLQQSPELLRNLRDSLAEQDAEGVRRATHSLKSSSANLGAHTLAGLCKELEHKGRNNSLEDSASLAGEVERHYDLVSRALTTLVGAASA